VRATEALRRIKTAYETGLNVSVVKAAEAARDEAAASLARAKEQVRRIKTIVDQGLLPRVELEKAEAERDKALANFEKAVQDLQKALKDLPAEVENAQQDLGKARATLEKAEEDLIQARKILPVEIQKAEADLDKAKADHIAAKEALAKAQEDLKRGTVVATVNGVVVDRKTNPGEIPKVGDLLLVLGRIDQILVETKVPEEKIGDVALGEKAIVTFNAFPNEQMTGEAHKIKPLTEQDSKTFIVDVRVPNPQLKLKPGLTAFTRFQHVRRALAVPSVALVYPTGTRESYVFVAGGDSVARLRRVKVGTSGDGLTAILGGLREGEQVVTVGHLYLRDNDRIRIGDEFEDTKVAQRKLPPEPIGASPRTRPTAEDQPR
jgi:membrane fusion protein (multidrug efflux system)